MSSIKDVINHHLKSFAERDLKGILSDYAPDAILFTPEGPLKGVDEIKPLFQAMIAEFEQPGAMFSLKQQSVEGDYAYILWTAETAENVYEVGTDTFVVQDGKIMAQSFTGKITPKGWKPSFATDFYRETKNLRIVQKAPGHAFLTTTQVYIHIVDDELENAMRGFRNGRRE